MYNDKGDVVIIIIPEANNSAGCGMHSVHCIHCVHCTVNTIIIKGKVLCCLLCGFTCSFVCTYQ